MGRHHGSACLRVLNKCKKKPAFINPMRKIMMGLTIVEAVKDLRVKVERVSRSFLIFQLSAITRSTVKISTNLFQR